MVRGLLNECTKMSSFDHPNVLTLVGVCLDGGTAPFIIMPYMENGNLLTYLRKNRELLLISPKSDQCEEEVLNYTIHGSHGDTSVNPDGKT